MWRKLNVAIMLISISALSNSQSTNSSENLCDRTAYSDVCFELGRKFYLIDGSYKLNWHEAGRFCIRQKAFLASVANARELTLISGFLISKGYLRPENNFFIGGNDLGSEGKFHLYHTGEIMPFTRWAAGEPNNLNQVEHCVVLTQRGATFQMNDTKCSDPQYFICEFIQNVYC